MEINLYLINDVSRETYRKRRWYVSRETSEKEDEMIIVKHW